MKSYLINGLLCLSFCAGAMPSDQAKPTLVGEPAATDSLHTRICPIDSLPCPDGKTSLHERYVSNYERRWYKLIPRYQKVQFAGSMGFMSFGTGWAYWKDRMESDVFLGFIPRYNDKHAKLTFTIKQNYIPWNLPIGDSRWSFDPLTCGIYMNSILDKRFWRSEPDRYPDNYYKFSTKIRFHIFAGQRITFDLDGSKTLHQSVSLFYEISSCDLYIISAATNRYLKPKDYLSLSFGVKLNVF